jgi:hypothetical protein
LVDAGEIGQLGAFFRTLADWHGVKLNLHLSFWVVESGINGSRRLIKLLHSADWQIGRVYSAFDVDDAWALHEARFKAVEKLAALASSHQVDAVLVAGDVFDLQTVSDKTIRRMFNAMAGFSGPWVLIPGNHDAALTESVWVRAERLGAVPKNVVCALTPKLLTLTPHLAILPAPLTQRHTAVDLTQWFDSTTTEEGVYRVGIAHGCYQGVLAEDIDSANPIAAGRASSAKLDYLALGDWHGTRQVDERTWYAGTPEPDRFKGNMPGNALLVTLSQPGGLPQVEVLAVAEFRWSMWERRLLGASDVEVLVGEIEQLGQGDVVQLKLSGACDLESHRKLVRAMEAAKARARALVCDDQGLRLEPTEADLEALRADGFVGEALAELRAQQGGDQDGVARDALLHLARVIDEQRAVA